LRRRKERGVVEWWRSALIVFGSVMASSGFWAFILKKDTARGATTRVLMGLTYHQITSLGMAYIQRGWITREEFEEYQKYFFDPYKALGGNGVAERIFHEVKELPFYPHSRYETIFTDRVDERFIPNVPVVTTAEKHAVDE
jgi:hypothetical protein